MKEMSLTRPAGKMIPATTTMTTSIQTPRHGSLRDRGRIDLKRPIQSRTEESLMKRMTLMTMMTTTNTTKTTMRVLRERSRSVPILLNRKLKKKMRAGKPILPEKMPRKTRRETRMTVGMTGR